jgi:hypothetical protein
VTVTQTQGVSWGLFVVIPDVVKKLAIVTWHYTTLDPIRIDFDLLNATV